MSDWCDSLWMVALASVGFVAINILQGQLADTDGLVHMGYG